jgi:hypothetical protein
LSAVGAGAMAAGGGKRRTALILASVALAFFL